MAQKFDQLKRIYKMTKEDYRSYGSFGGPVCHYGRSPDGKKVQAHVVGPEDQWADVITKPKGNPTHGCLVHMKEFYPEAFDSKPDKVAVPTDTGKCPECDSTSADMEEEAGFKCGSCDEVAVAEDYDQYTLRECSNDDCGQTFVAVDGNNCPQCNRPFTRRLADVGCTECEEGEMEGITVRKCPDCEHVWEVTPA